MVRPISLSTKLSCTVSLLVAAVLLALAFLAQHYFEGHLKETISRQQFTMVSALAEQVDDKILSARDELAVVAKSITPEIVRDPARAEHFLKGRLVVSSLIFDSGLFLLTPSCTMFAGTSMEPQMRRRNYSHRDYFRKTVATGKPCVSDPFFSTKQSGHPTVVFTAPVYDRHGQMIALERIFESFFTTNGTGRGRGWPSCTASSVTTRGASPSGAGPARGPSSSSISPCWMGRNACEQRREGGDHGADRWCLVRRQAVQAG